MTVRSSKSYRKVGTNTWGDAKFASLSDRGKLLWFYLLTGPDTTSLPGVVVAGRAHMAEVLGWQAEAFDEAFAEVLAKDMARFDPKARVVWLPNAHRYNAPESPNVVRGWGKAWSRVPECDLKRQAFQALKDFVQGLGEGFSKAFAEAFAEGFGKALHDPLPNQGAGNREQRAGSREQEAENSNPVCAPERVRTPAQAPASAHTHEREGQEAVEPPHRAGAPAGYVGPSEPPTNAQPASGSAQPASGSAQPARAESEGGNVYRLPITDRAPSSPQAALLLEAIKAHKGLAHAELARSSVADQLWGQIMTSTIKVEWAVEAVHDLGRKADMALARGEPMQPTRLSDALTSYVARARPPHQAAALGGAGRPPLEPVSRARKLLT